MSTMPIDDLMNVDEAAAIIGVTTGRVRQMLRDGEMKGRKANERAWLVAKEEVQRVADEEKKTGRPRSGK
jgi:excisionase family DNA binding protein